jgi:hypothetical protein
MNLKMAMLPVADPPFGVRVAVALPFTAVVAVLVAAPVAVAAGVTPISSVGVAVRVRV